MVVEDGEGFVAVEGEEGFESLPFAVINLDGELLGAAVMGAVGGFPGAGESADFVFEFPAFGPPGDEDGVGVGFDEAEALGGGFEVVGGEILR